MSRPSSSTSPETRALGTTSCMRLRARRNVDFPHPEGPIRAVTCFGSTRMLMSFRAWNAPNQTLRPSTSMRLAILGTWSDKPVATGEEAGEHGQDQHDGDQRKGTSPCSRYRDTKRRLGLAEDEQRQGRLGAGGRVGGGGGRGGRRGQQG